MARRGPLGHKTQLLTANGGRAEVDKIDAEDPSVDSVHNLTVADLPTDYVESR